MIDFIKFFLRWFVIVFGLFVLVYLTSPKSASHPQHDCMTKEEAKIFKKNNKIVDVIIFKEMDSNIYYVWSSKPESLYMTVKREESLYCIQERYKIKKVIEHNAMEAILQSTN